MPHELMKKSLNWIYVCHRSDGDEFTLAGALKGIKLFIPMEYEQ
jgi:hypothetical protein